MTEPRIEGPLGDLKFRGPARSFSGREPEASHFWVGIAIFLGVALVYPFYSYKVHAQLAARDVAAAMTEFAGEMDAMNQQSQRRSVEVARNAAAQAADRRQQGIAVAGTTIVGGKRIVIVQLGQASLAEAKESICRQAAVRFHESLAGERLRIQRHRGSLPAVEAGTIVCE